MTLKIKTSPLPDGHQAFTAAPVRSKRLRFCERRGLRSSFLRLLVLARRCDKSLEQVAEFAAMLSRRRVNDEGLAFARSFNLSHAESDSLEPPPDLGCTRLT